MISEIYRAEGVPVLQNRTYETREQAVECTRGDVVLVQDLRTGLIFNSAFAPDLIQYDENYQNEQAASQSFRSHLRQVSVIVQRHFRNRSILEIGCGKGFFLKYLQDLGFNVIGVDPAYEGDNPSIIKAKFSASLGVRAQCLILRHVLEHIPSPYEFLADLRETNDGGLVYIEVPCLDWIAERRAWFDIYYEHVNYFRLDDFKRLFGNVLECGHLFGGQYIYVVADLATLREPVMDRGATFAFPEDFLASLIHLSRQIRTRDVPAIVWGGASKGVIFSIFMERAGAGIDAVVDLNPAKQGRYLPVTGLRVSSPEEVLQRWPTNADIYVMNSNYTAEIRHMTRNQYRYFEVDNNEFRA